MTQAQVNKGGGHYDDLDVADFDADDAFEDDLGDDGYEDDFEEEEMDDVWDAEDEDEDDGFDTGESKVGDFVAPKGGDWMVQDQPWGTLWTVFVSCGAVFSVLSAFVGIELVRTMWLWTQPGEPTSGLLGMLGGMFGK